MHTYEPRCRFDHNRAICKRSSVGRIFFMPTDVSALQLVLTADPTLIAIVRLSLIVSLSAVLLAEKRVEAQTNCEYSTGPLNEGSPDAKSLVCDCLCPCADLARFGAG